MLFYIFEILRLFTVSLEIIVIQMALQVSWPRDMPADSLESGNMEIQESGNLGVWNPTNLENHKFSEWTSVLPTMFAGPHLEKQHI